MATEEITQQLISALNATTQNYAGDGLQGQAGISSVGLISGIIILITLAIRNTLYQKMKSCC